MQSSSCSKCNNCFFNEENIALFKQCHYHLKCFICFDCSKQLSDKSFYLDEQLQLNIKNPQVYCESCYMKRSSLCTKCNQRFTPNSIIIEYLNKEYHNECFQCSKCQNLLREKTFYVKNCEFLCQTCCEEIEPYVTPLESTNLKDDRCKKCGKQFRYGETISIYLCDKYHSDCFKCSSCAKNMIGQGFFRQEGGLLYCLDCHIDKGPQCSICKEPFLTGEILSKFDGRQFHNTCFLCKICRQPIEAKTFRYENCTPTCESCVNKK